MISVVQENNHFIWVFWFNWLLASTEEEQHSNPALSSNKQIQCRIGSNPREIVAWVLVVILVVLLSMSLTINGVQAVWTHRKSNKPDHDASPDCALAMDSNPCYEASIVKQTETKEAVHVYDTVKQV